MAGSLNKATLIGRLGKDPETRHFNNGGMVCNFSLATSESWKDKATGEKKERTEWHRVCIFNEHLAKIAGQYLKSGDMVYLEGSIETRKYEKDGRDIYTTEIVLRPYNGALKILSSKRNTGEETTESESQAPAGGSKKANDMDDEIPF